MRPSRTESAHNIASPVDRGVFGTDVTFNTESCEPFSPDTCLSRRGCLEAVSKFARHRKLSRTARPARRRRARILAGGETAGYAFPHRGRPVRGAGRSRDLRFFRCNRNHSTRYLRDAVRRPSRTRRFFGDSLPVVSPPANIRARLQRAGMLIGSCARQPLGVLQQPLWTPGHLPRSGR